jgi:predicted nicotinamide N-methyase
MAVSSAARLRAFVREWTRLRAVAGVPGIRLHQADDAMTTMRATGVLLGLADPPLPFWAFPWAGGLAVVARLLAHPDEVAGRSVLDLASGSGLCAIVAARAGAIDVEAVDVDPIAEAAIGLNARANGVEVRVSRRDLLDAPPPAFDVILAGDVCYEETMAARMMAWLTAAAATGTRVLVGDPGRAYLPAGLAPLGTYRVATSRELERAESTFAGVFTIAGPENDVA